jgi:hypothetical protein
MFVPHFNTTWDFVAPVCLVILFRECVYYLTMIKNLHAALKVAAFGIRAGHDSNSSICKPRSRSLKHERDLNEKNIN